MKRAKRGEDMDLKTKIREVPDFPKEGILFYDVTTLLQDSAAFRYAVDEMVRKFRESEIQKVVAVESRGFIFGAPLAYQLGAGFIPVRKPGKLPAEKFEEKYDLEYGKDALAIHSDAIRTGERVLIVDDLLATGGTVQTTVNLVRRLKGEIMGIAFLIELSELKGRQKVNGFPIHTLITY
jgi:adenine phosphoribosyltransferase